MKAIGVYGDVYVKFIPCVKCHWFEGWFLLGD